MKLENTLEPHIALAIALFTGLNVFATQLEPPPVEGQTFAHDPSTLIKAGDYYLFNTGNGIQFKRSSDRILWTNLPPVFSSPPSWTTNSVPGFKGHFWAPDIIRLGELYHLYYSVSTFGSQVSAIALATSPTLDPNSPDYLWTDHGPIIESKVGSPFNAIDPGLLLDSKGNLWMSFGSFWRGIYMVQLDPTTGRRIAPDSPFYHLAYTREIEAPSLYERGDFFYLFVNWGKCCRGTNSTYEVRVGRSKDVRGPYLDREGKDLVQQGGTLFLETTGRYIGPGHVSVFAEDGQEWFTYHYYDQELNGRPRFAIAPLYWTEDGWPSVRPTNNSLPEKSRTKLEPE